MTMRCVGLLLGAVACAGLVSGCSPAVTVLGPASISETAGMVTLPEVDQPDYVVREDLWRRSHTGGVALRVDLPSMPAAGLDCVAMTGRSTLSSSGEGRVDAVDPSAAIMAILTPRGSREPAAVVYVPAAAAGQTRALGAREVALGCVATHPSLLLSPAAARDAALRWVQGQPGFEALVADVDALWASSAEDFLRGAVAQGLISRAAGLAEGALSARAAAVREAVGNSWDPYVDDLPGAAVEFVNPTMVAYGAEVRDANGDVTGVKLVAGKASEMLLTPWPTWRNPVREPYALGDGHFTIRFTKGYDLTQVGSGSIAYDLESAEGQATIANLMNLATVVTDAFGLFGLDQSSSSWIAAIQATIDKLEDFGAVQGIQASLGQYRLFDAIVGLIQFELASVHLDTLSRWLWDSLPSWLAGDFLAVLQATLGILSTVFESLDFANSDGPFLVDLAFSPWQVTYAVRQTDGVLASDPDA
ncbi:MAG TPA: hypothetical protein PLD23_14455 [Armatimonadota bacterium]|nr:hypothetical protein [Armatimonadota bacterium]